MRIWCDILKDMTTQTFEALAKSRFSARDFLNKPVDSEILETILQTAAQSPSWSNTRGYMLAIAQGERKQQLIDAYTQKCKAMFRTKDATLSEEERLIAQKMSQPDGDFPVMAPYPQSLKERSARLGLALYKHLNIDRKDFPARNAHTLRNFQAFGAPVMGFVLVRRDFLPFAALDAGIMLQTLLLAAKEQGVDSCPLGVLATWRSPLDEVFDIPTEYALITGFALGYASEAHVNAFRAEHPPIELAREK